MFLWKISSFSQSKITCFFFSFLKTDDTVLFSEHIATTRLWNLLLNLAHARCRWWWKSPNVENTQERGAAGALWSQHLLWVTAVRRTALRCAQRAQKGSGCLKAPACECFLSSVTSSQPPVSSPKHGSVLERHIKILLAQMMKFLQFPCLTIHQRMYSFPSGECCPTLCQDFRAPPSFVMLLHSSQMWVGHTGSLPRTTVGAGWGLMWAQLYEKQMGTDWEKILPSNIQAQARQGNCTSSLHQQKNLCLQDLNHLDFSAVQFGATTQEKHRNTPPPYFSLCIRHITEPTQK